MFPSNSWAVIVKEGVIVATGQYLVQSTFDITNHAEIVAIRRASEELGTTDLSDCQIYVSSYPCPMCKGACDVAQIGSMFYIQESSFEDSDLKAYIENLSTLDTSVEYFPVADSLKPFLKLRELRN